MVWKLPKREPPSPPRGLKVDVFIPTLNEDISILRRTILGCLRMSYPHKVFVLDDGKRPEVRKLCEELGCGYITREDNKNAKAGNLNNALKYTDGDFIAVFDADHVPNPEFLERTLGYFRDPKVAFVQTPQDFYNVDSYQHRIVRGKLWHEQALFFRVIMRGKDRLNSSFFCGSCAVIRRKALEDIGGFATGTVTEDLHTSVKLHSKGWRSVYHPEPLAYGLAPSGIGPYKTQRERWGRGAMQVFVKDNPLLVKGLSLSQRLSYMASMITYFDGFQKLIYYVAPIVVLTADVYPIDTPLSEFLLFFIPHFLLSILAFEEMSRGYGRMHILEQYNVLRFLTFMKSVLGFFDFGKVRFKVTDKSIRIKGDVKEVLPQILLSACTIAGIVCGLWKLPTSARPDVYAANIFWASVNLTLTFLALLWTLRRKQRRRNFRFPANVPAIVKYKEKEYPVTVLDINEEGASLISRVKGVRGKVKLLLEFEDIKLDLKGRVVYSTKGTHVRYGLEFVDLSEEEKDAIRDVSFRFLLTEFMKRTDCGGRTLLSFILRDLWRIRFRRTSRRKRVHLPGLVISGSGAVPFSTEDISDGGLKIVTLKRIRGGQVYVNVNGSVRVGKVVWWDKLNFYGFTAYRYGIRFERQENVFASPTAA